MSRCAHALSTAPFTPPPSHTLFDSAPAPLPDSKAPHPLMSQTLTSERFYQEPQAVLKGLCSHPPTPARRDARFTE